VHRGEARGVAAEESIVAMSRVPDVSERGCSQAVRR